MQLKESSKGQFVLKCKEICTYFNINTMKSTVEQTFDIVFSIFNRKNLQISEN